MNTRRSMLALLSVLAAGAAAAAQPAAEVDAELLEFLGSLDTEDEEWREYLADRPIRTEAGKPDTAATPAAGRRPAPDAKQQEQDKVEKP